VETLRLPVRAPGLYPDLRRIFLKGWAPSIDATRFSTSVGWTTDRASFNEPRASGLGLPRSTRTSDRSWSDRDSQIEEKSRQRNTQASDRPALPHDRSVQPQCQQNQLAPRPADSLRSNRPLCASAIKLGRADRTHGPGCTRGRKRRRRLTRNPDGGDCEPTGHRKGRQMAFDRKGFTERSRGTRSAKVLKRTN